MPAAEPLAPSMGSAYTPGGPVGAPPPGTGGDLTGTGMNTWPNGAEYATTTSGMNAWPPGGEYAITTSTTTAYSGPSLKVTPITPVPAAVGAASFGASRTTTHCPLIAATLVPLSRATEITTRTTTAYSPPPDTTSTTTAYAAVTASYVAVVMDTPPYRPDDQPHGTGAGVGSSKQHRMGGQESGNTSKVGMIILSVLTALLGLVALAASVQCILNFLRNVSHNKTVAEVP